MKNSTRNPWMKAAALVAVAVLTACTTTASRTAARWPGSRLLEVQGADHASVIASPLVLAAIRQLMDSAR